MSDDKKKDLQEEYKEAQRQMHQSWLINPITIEFLKCMKIHREKFVSSLSDKVNDPSIPDAAFRQIAVNVRNTDALIKLATDTETFVNQLNIQQKQ